MKARRSGRSSDCRDPRTSFLDRRNTSLVNVPQLCLRLAHSRMTEVCTWKQLHRPEGAVNEPHGIRLSYDFSRREGEKEPLGEGGCPLVSGEGRIGNTL